MTPRDAYLEELAEHRAELEALYRSAPRALASEATRNPEPSSPGASIAPDVRELGIRKCVELRAIIAENTKRRRGGDAE